LCIGAREAVWSVLLISSRPPQELGGVEIAVTGESASGFNVLRVLLERRFGVQPTYRVVDDPLAVALAGKPALLIGDTAIEARARIAEHAVYDLGCLWNEWTGCDMVFAVWVARRDVLQARRDDVAAAMTAMCTSYAWGRSHMPEVLARAEAAYSRPPGFYEHYYRTLNFDFDSQAQAGLARFASELENLRAIAPSRARIPEDLACHSLA
jgi:chorismate dehydratase